MMHHSNPHDSTSKFTTRLFPGLLISCLIFSSGTALAVSDLSIMGSLELVTANAEGTVNQVGKLSSTIGGTTTNTGFDSSVITSGNNPLDGELTTIGDGFRASTNLDSEFESEFNYITKFVIDFDNKSSTDDYKVSFNFNFNHKVNANGAESYAESKLDIEMDNVDIGSSEILSDTDFGDQKNGADLLTFGEEISDLGSLDLDVIIAAGTIHQFMATWEWEGGVFEGSGLSLITENSFAEVKITNIINLTTIPLPGALVFFASSLFGIGLFGRRNMSITQS